MGASQSRMLLGTRHYQIGTDGGFSIGHAARNGKYKTKGTLVVDLRAYALGVRALEPPQSEILTSIISRYI